AVQVTCRTLARRTTIGPRNSATANLDFRPTPQRQPTVSASSTVKMRTYDDSFSGQKIYPGKGKLYVRGDSKIFRFQNGKSESLFLQRKNPRRIAWTVLYRRQHRKGISEEVAKKRSRRVVKSQRAIVGASLEQIKERRSQRPEAREAARKQAIKDAKEKKTASESQKKAEKAKNAANAAKGGAQRIASKQGAKGSAPKVAAKSR
ncbi:ribosomal protein L24e-domain-containing protein, partial [Penicillium chermesinum]